MAGVTTGNVVTVRMHRTSGFLAPHLELRDASDTLVASATGATLTLTLPPNGPFTVHASDDGNDSTGDYELFLERLDGACNAVDLSCGSRVGATLPTRARVHTYDLIGVASGDVVTLRMHNTSGFLKSYLELYDGTGTLLQEGAGATLSLTLPSAGPYTLLARDDDYGSTGDYGVSLVRLDGSCNAPDLVCGERMGDSIATRDEIDVYSLSGVEAGNVVSLRMHSTSGFLTPYLELYDAAGSLVQEGTGANLTLTLPSAGPYTLLARDDDYGSTGDYGISLVRLDGSCNAPDLVCGERMGDSIATRDEIDVYSLSGVEAGNVVSLRMHSTSGFLTPYLELYDADGSLVQEGTGGTLTLTLPSAGPYTLLARDDGYGSTGNYGVSLVRLDGGCNAPELVCGERMGDLIATRDEIDVYSLSGVEAGHVVSLRMHSTSGFLTPYLELYDADGSLVQEGTGANLTLTLPSAGPYTLLARDDDYGSTGDYGVSLVRLDGGCNAAALACGESTSESISTADEIDSFSLSAVDPGDSVTFRMQDLSGFLVPYAELYDGSGNLVGEGPGPLVTMTVSGTEPYSLLTRDDDYGDTGDYILLPQRFDSPCRASSLGLGGTETATLATSSQIDTYSLQGIAAEDTVTVCMDAVSDFGPALELYDGEGTLLGSDFQFFSGGIASVSTTLSGSQPFTALAMDNAHDDTGDYEISLRGAVSSCASTDTSPPTVTAIAPQRGELVSAGSRYLIRWSSADDVGVTSHTVRLSTDGGATFPTVIASGLSGAAQSYLWIVPVSMRSTTARIRVVARDATGATGQGETAGDFVLVDDPPPREISYSYDSLNRLTGVEYSDGSTITYVYDEVGNRETMTSTGPVVIHEDGFEGGDTSGWTGATGEIEVVPEAARTGSFGLRVNVGCPPGSDLVVPDGTVGSGTFEACNTVRADAVRVDPGPVLFRAGRRVLLGDGFSVASGAGFTAATDPTLAPGASVRDDSPVDASRYAARFSVRLDGLDLAPEDRFVLFSGSDDGGTETFRLILERDGADTENRLIIEAWQDDGTVLSTFAAPAPVGAGWHTVELQWRASEPSAADGRIDVLLDGTPRARLTGLDNATARIDAVSLGTMDPGRASTGFIDLDDFRSQPGL